MESVSHWRDVRLADVRLNVFIKQQAIACQSVRCRREYVHISGLARV
jgi:hypothetical protein